ncbi:MAG: hypothetical protein HFI33_05720 [Lachnospiraceae bacterium]|nr:hypothetical protein [Lachnospiraceae bacterium]
MKRRIIALVTLSILALTSLAGCGSKNAESSTNTPVATEGENQEETSQTSNPGTDAKVIKLASTKPTESFAYEGLEKFKSLVEERSNGSLIVELYPASQLGGKMKPWRAWEWEPSKCAMCQLGRLRAFIPSPALWGRYLQPEMRIMRLKFGGVKWDRKSWRRWHPRLVSVS